MNFADLNAQVADLRHAFQTQIGPKSMGEVGVRGPAGLVDEAAFLRLTAWCFALLFEQGRITIPFLLQPVLVGADAAEAKQHKATRALVQALRTWLFHSLTADSDRDLDVSKAVSVWFLVTCKSTSPQSAAEWEMCFRALCAQVTDLVAYCTKTISRIVTDPEDGGITIRELQNRLRREWVPYQFDALAENAATRLGEKINARVFRESRLSKWRSYLAALPDDADSAREMERLIDGEVSDHFRTTLPLPIREIVEELGLEQGPRVKQAVEILRQLHDSGIRDKGELLAGVKARLVVKEA